MTIYRSYTDVELRRLITGLDTPYSDDLAHECVLRFMSNQSDVERIAELEEQIQTFEDGDAIEVTYERKKRIEIEAELDATYAERDDLQLQVDTLTQTIDAIVNSQ